MSWTRDTGGGFERRGYHHGNLREALIQAAQELIGAKGPAGFTIAEAARLDVGVGRPGLIAGEHVDFLGPDRDAVAVALDQVGHAYEPGDKGGPRPPAGDIVPVDEPRWPSVRKADFGRLGSSCAATGSTQPLRSNCS